MLAAGSWEAGVSSPAAAAFHRVKICRLQRDESKLFKTLVASTSLLIPLLVANEWASACSQLPICRLTLLNGCLNTYATLADP